MTGRQLIAILIGISALLQVLIFPTPAVAWLSWIALVPLLYALIFHAQTAPPRARMPGFLIGYACGVLWYLGTCYWIYKTMHEYGRLDPVVSVLVLIGFALYLGLYHALFGWLFTALVKRLGSVKALLLAPALWVAVELARFWVTGFPWNLLGGAQIDNASLMLLVPVTGVYGASFYIAAVNAAFVVAFVSSGRRRKLAVSIFAAAIAIPLLGNLRAPVVAPKPTHEAVLVQQNIPIADGVQWTAEYFDQTIAAVAEVSRIPRAATPANGPRLLIWPESPAPFYVNDPKFRHWVSTVAADQNAFLIAGSVGMKATGNANNDYEIYNSATLIAPSGEFIDRYDKVHLVPFGEYVPFKKILFFANELTREVSNFTPGARRNVLTLAAVPAAAEHKHHPGMEMPPPAPVTQPAGTKAGVFICYESIFPDEVRQFARHGAEVLVNISNDGWYGNSGAIDQHLAMARMRALENRRWVLRATNTGVTASIDPYGRIVARAPRNVRTSLAAPYSLVSEQTVYTRWGDWFAYLCAIITLAALVLAFFRRPAE